MLYWKLQYCTLYTHSLTRHINVRLEMLVTQPHQVYQSVPRAFGVNFNTVHCTVRAHEVNFLNEPTERISHLVRRLRQFARSEADSKQPLMVDTCLWKPIRDFLK